MGCRKRSPRLPSAGDKTNYLCSALRPSRRSLYSSYISLLGGIGELKKSTKDLTYFRRQEQNLTTVARRPHLTASSFNRALHLLLSEPVTGALGCNR